MSGSSFDSNPLLTPEQEAEALSRVETQLIAEFRAMHAPPASSWSRLWAAGLGMGAVAAAAAVLLFVVQPWSSPTVPLSLQGGATLAAGHQASQATVPVEVKKGQTGAISEVKRWSMKMAQRTRLALVKTERLVRTVRLKRGFVKVHVKKGAMKRFVVQSGGVQVLVTGTVFSVEREAKWLRVELFRGGVTVRQSAKRSHTLEPGDGVRIDLQSGRFQKYRFSVGQAGPEAAKKPVEEARFDPWSRLRWLAKYGKFNALFRYAVDLAESRQYSVAKRRSMLSWVVDRLYKHSSSKAMRIFLAMANLGGEGNETNFGSAVTACRRVFRLDTTQCIHLYREYLKRYPQGMLVLRKQVACFLSEDLAKKSPKFLREAKMISTKYRCE